MRSVWSFWSRPHEHARKRVWLTERHHLLSWVLSVETARRHYPDTALVTDAAGARMLVDGLEIPFARVSTELDALDGSDPEFWALGKLYAYAAQDRPFVHVDADVFLWSALPERLAAAPVFTQNPEPFEPGHPFYRPERVEEWLRAEGGWVPEEWSWYLRSGRPLRGDCCGILGGRDVELIGRYASEAVRTAEDPANRAAWSRVPNRQVDSLCLEQFYLSACVERRGRGWSTCSAASRSRGRPGRRPPPGTPT
ncbi:MAG TPA: DUF6734 family protein [Longimicrobiaceae bacterium]|nr:DUF6734 family protein [Longimicrobiaceae bacterium]